MEEIKVTFLGYEGVGKTNLINGIIGLEFLDKCESTISCNFVTKKMKIKNKDYQVNFWDTCGMEKFKPLTKIFIKNSQIIILVFDITNRKSFDELEYWINTVKETLSNDCVIGIIGNKIDLFEYEQVSEEEAKSFAKSKGYYYTRLSAKEYPKDINNFIDLLIDEYFKNIPNQEEIKYIKLDPVKDLEEKYITKIKARNIGCCGHSKVKVTLKYSFMERYKSNAIPWYFPRGVMIKEYKDGKIELYDS